MAADAADATGDLTRASGSPATTLEAAERGAPSGCTAPPGAGRPTAGVPAGTGVPAARGPSGSARVFWRYWTASTISSTGTAVTAVALPLVAVKALGASSFQISLITVASYVAWLAIGLPAGVVVARLPLRGTQVTMDLVRAVALLSVPVAGYLARLRLAQLVLVALVVGLASVVFDVANATFLPSIVSRAELTSRNSLNSGAHAATQLGGPSLGGVLVAAFGAPASLLADVTSYLVSALLLRGLPRGAPAPAAAPAGAAGVSGPRPSTAVLISQGWRYVTRHPIIRPSVAGATLINFVCGGLMALTPVFLVRTLHAPTALVGLLIATEGAGSLAGAAVTTRLAARMGSARATVVAAVGAAACAALMPLATGGWGLWLFAAGNAGFAAGVVVMSILWRTHRQVVTPPDLLSRVVATVRFISWGAIPFGALAAGAAANALGNRDALWLMCALALLTPLVLLASPIRARRDLADA